MILLPCLIIVGGGAGFLNVPILTIIIVLPFLMSLTSFSLADTLSGIKAIGLIVTDSVSIVDPLRTQRVLRSYIHRIYVSATIVAASILCGMLRDLGDVSIIPTVAFLCVLDFLYAIILAECFFRPALYQTQNLVEKEKKR